jgi:hypothetical protein
VNDELGLQKYLYIYSLHSVFVYTHAKLVARCSVWLTLGSECAAILLS